MRRWLLWWLLVAVVRTTSSDKDTKDTKDTKDHLQHAMESWIYSTTTTTTSATAPTGFKIPITLNILLVGLNTDPSHPVIDVAHFKALLSAQMPTHTPWCGVGTPKERALNMYYDITYNVVHQSPALLPRFEKLLQQSMVPATDPLPPSLTYTAAEIRLSSTFEQQLDQLIQSDPAPPPKASHTLVVLAPRKEQIRPSFATKESNAQWHYTYVDGEQDPQSRPGTESSFKWLSRGRYVVLDVVATSASSSMSSDFVSLSVNPF